MRSLVCAFYTLGCKVNIYESEALAGELQALGHRIVSWDEAADIYIINGCAVTAQAAAKTRQAARRVKRDYPRAKLVLLGCYSAAEPDQALELGADLVLDNTQKPHLAQHLQQINSEGAATVPPVEDGEEEFSFSEYAGNAPLDHTRALVKIQDGCNNRCAYCIIPDLRGSERSRPLEAVRSEVCRLRDLGYKELVLTGIHLSRWGQDFIPERRLVDLLRELLKLQDLPRLRLSSVEPTDIDDDLVELFSRHDLRLCPHLHIPLQSGCDATLRRMGRRYLTADYRHIIGKLRQAIPDVALTTDLIVGFPGESEEEFLETLSFCEEMAFSRMHIFRFSSRKGTPAAEMPGKVSRVVQEERSARMHQLSQRMAATYAARFVSQSVHVLLEHKDSGCNEARGYSEHYLPCTLDYPAEIPREGLLCTMRVLQSSSSGLSGEVTRLI